MMKYYCQNCGKEIKSYERREIRIINPMFTNNLTHHRIVKKVQVGKDCCLKTIDEHMGNMKKIPAFKRGSD